MAKPSAAAAATIPRRLIACASAAIFVVASLHLPSARSFALSPTPTARRARSGATSRTLRLRDRDVASAASHPAGARRRANPSTRPPTTLRAEGGGESDGATTLGESESALLGVAGVFASLVMMYSESVLFRTGCGLPAGPLGLVGAAEGVSYLGAVGLVGFSLFAKVRTGSGLPAGPGGILGAAEGLAYLAAFAGVCVLVAQITNYGYIPNAVPIDGGMCS
ncbi:hypothetical protein ACHAWF_001079 [Thalassiosira exigua]